MKRLLLLSIAIILFIVSCRKAKCPSPNTGGSNTNSSETCSLISNWSSKNASTVETLLFSQFLSSSTGYLAGYSGSLLKTTDGGNTFNALNLGTTEDVNSMYFKSATEGYVATNVRQLTTTSSHLYKTVDGGQTFSTINPGVSMYFRNINFLTQNIGFACGGLYPYSGITNGALIKTIDGGNTWTQVTVPNLYVASKVYFIDNSIGFICGSNGQIFRTSDGGNTWTELTFNLNNTAALADVLLMDITFINSNTGFCVGFSRSYDESYILKTTDAGITWNRVQFPASGFATTNFLGSIKFTNDKIGYISGGNPANNQGCVYKTSDGGTTWTQSYIASSWLSRMSVVDCNTIYISGNNGTVVKSIN